MPKRKDRASLLYPLNAIAEIFGVSTRTISSFVEKGMPKAERGKYDIAKCYRWLVEYLRSGDGRRRRPDGKVDNSQRELLAARTAKIDMEIAQMSGELLPLDLFRRVILGMASTLTTQLEALGPRLAGELVNFDAAEIEALIRKETDHIFQAATAEAGQLDYLRREHARAGAEIEDDDDD